MLDIYINDWLIYDNSNVPLILIARYNQEQGLSIDNKFLWQKLQGDFDE